MAENTFGSYSGVPSTGGQGQGLAQVFKPQAIGLDTSSLERGAYAAAQGIGQGLENKAAKEQAAAAKKQADSLELQKRFNEMSKDGVYSINNGARDVAIERFYGADNSEQALAQLESDLKRLKSTEDEIIKPFVKRFTSDPNLKVQDEEGNYVSGMEAVNFLMSDLKDDPEALEAANSGNYNEWLQNKVLAIEKGSMSYDPEFDLNTEAVKLYNQFTPKVQSDISATIQEMQSNTEYDLETILSRRPDSKAEVLQFLQSNGALMDKWAAQSVVRGNQPAEVYKDRKTYGGELEKQYFDAVSNLILPSQPLTRKLSTKRKPTEGDGDGTDNESGLNFGSASGIQTVDYNKEDGTLVKRNVLGIGDKSIAGQKIQGTTVKDGKRLAVGANGKVIPDSEDIAESYINSVKSTLDKTEKESYTKALEEQKSAAPIKVKPDPIKIEALNGKLEEASGFIYDSEDEVIKYIEDETGYTLEKEYKKAMLEFLEDNDISNFTKPTHREAIIKYMLEEFPDYFISDEVITEEEKAPAQDNSDPLDLGL